MKDIGIPLHINKWPKWHIMCYFHHLMVEKNLEILLLVTKKNKNIYLIWLVYLPMLFQINTDKLIFCKAEYQGSAAKLAQFTSHLTPKTVKSNLWSKKLWLYAFWTKFIFIINYKYVTRLQLYTWQLDTQLDASAKSRDSKK